MTFRTPIKNTEIHKRQTPLNYQSKIGLFGSCFVENIGEKLSYFKFKNFVNPYGILFNPKAIEKALTDIVQQRFYEKSDLVFENERWHSLHHHSDFSNAKLSIILEDINQSIHKTHQDLQEASHLIITLGTAWVYHHIASDQLVANCHKIPQNNFIKRILSVAEITKNLKEIITLARQINPSIQLLFTLSPVRHLKDGIIENSQSKAQLLTAIHQVVSDLEVDYFPSYEIILDDLRDYRFYKSDMLHPNQTAIDYIWGVFKNSWISDESYSIMQQVDKVQKALEHKAFNPDSEQYKNFISQLNQQKEALKKSHNILF